MHTGRCRCTAGHRPPGLVLWCTGVVQGIFHHGGFGFAPKLRAAGGCFDHVADRPAVRQIAEIHRADQVGVGGNVVHRPGGHRGVTGLGLRRDQELDKAPGGSQLDGGVVVRRPQRTAADEHAALVGAADGREVGSAHREGIVGILQYLLDRGGGTQHYRRLAGGEVGDAVLVFLVELVHQGSHGLAVDTTHRMLEGQLGAAGVQRVEIVADQRRSPPGAR